MQALKTYKLLLFRDSFPPQNTCLTVLLCHSKLHFCILSVFFIDSMHVCQSLLSKSTNDMAPTRFSSLFIYIFFLNLPVLKIIFIILPQSVSHPEKIWGRCLQFRILSTFLNTTKTLLIYIVLHTFMYFFLAV